MGIKGFQDIPFDEYLDLDMLSNSGLKLIAKTPQHYRSWKDEPIDIDPTPAQFFGKMFHQLMLEPEIFDRNIVVWDGFKRGKDWTEFQKRYADRIIMSKDDFLKLYDMKHSIYASDIAKAFFRDRYRKEQTVIWKDSQYGFDCKARPDITLPKIETLVDLKTAADASEWEFGKAIYNFKYHWQAAWYLNGANTVQKDVYFRNFVWIVIEKSYPFVIAIYRASQAMLDQARKEISPLLKLYNECLETDIWEGYPDSIQDIYLPSWA